MNPLFDLLADGPIVGLHFKTGGGTSRNVRNFVSELTALLSTTPKKPLIITNDYEAVAIFRVFVHAELRNARGLALDFTGAHRFSDFDGYDGQLYIELEHAGANVVGITLPDDGKWADGTPENTARSALPVFDSDAISNGIESLLDRWGQAGKLVGVASSPPVRQDWTAPVYADEISIANPPGDMDAANPLRRDPEWVRTIRKFREKVLGRDSGAVIEGPAGRVSRAEFDAAYSAEVGAVQTCEE